MNVPNSTFKNELSDIFKNKIDQVFKMKGPIIRKMRHTQQVKIQSIVYAIGCKLDYCLFGARLIIRRTNSELGAQLVLFMGKVRCKFRVRFQHLLRVQLAKARPTSVRLIKAVHIPILFTRNERLNTVLIGEQKVMLNGGLLAPKTAGASIRLLESPRACTKIPKTICPKVRNPLYHPNKLAIHFAHKKLTVFTYCC